MKTLIIKLWSWWNGRYPGEVVYEKACPFITGEIHNFLPIAVQTDCEKSTLRFRFWKYQWIGWKWERLGICVFTYAAIAEAEGRA
jgi:hypothetical protein